MIDKVIIEKNFSRYARYYDKYSAVQDRSALYLSNQIKTDKTRSILDIGCGTGTYTKILSEKFPKAQITAVDISKDMLSIARGKLRGRKVRFITLDGERLRLNKTFDLITSNACFQWLENLDKTLQKYRKYLSEKGIITFSIFGPATFSELNSSLWKVFGKDPQLSACGFIGKLRLTNMLKKSFKDIEIRKRSFKQKHDSVVQLLKMIKYTGTTGSGAALRGLWTPKILSKLEKAYRMNSKELEATYEVFFCKGIK